MAKMKNIFILIIVFVSYNCNAPQEHADKIKLEFRLAETQPGPGLKEMSMYKTGDKFYVHNRILLTNDDIKSARFTLWQNHPGIELSMTDSGKAKWAGITGQNMGKNIAMILDGKLVCAPLVRARIDVGIAIINGLFTEKEARRIASGLSSE